MIPGCVTPGQPRRPGPSGPPAPATGAAGLPRLPDAHRSPQPRPARPHPALAGLARYRHFPDHRLGLRGPARPDRQPQPGHRHRRQRRPPSLPTPAGSRPTYATSSGMARTLPGSFSGRRNRPPIAARQARAATGLRQPARLPDDRRTPPGRPGPASACRPGQHAAYCDIEAEHARRAGPRPARSIITRKERSAHG